jgi:hypothetical protein
MIDIISLVIGFAIGLVVFGLAVEVGMKRTTKSEPASRHTKTWKISEISNPRIIAEYLGDVEIPKDSKLIVKKYKDKEMLKGLNVKEHSDIKGNFILGDDRALILAGPVKKDEIGFWTVEKDIVDRLNEQFDQLWSEGTKMSIEEKK